MRLAPWVVTLLLTDFSDSGSCDLVLIINNQQSLVMDPSVLSAGIPATPSLLTIDRGQLYAYSILSNNHFEPVTMYYRFY